MEPNNYVKNEILQLVELPKKITLQWIKLNIKYKDFSKQLYEISSVDEKIEVLRRIVNQKLVELYGVDAPRRLQFYPTGKMIANLEIHFFYRLSKNNRL